MKRCLSVLLVLLLFVCLATSVFASGADSTSSGLWEWLGGKVSNGYQLIKNIFVPKEDYFHNKLEVLNDLVNDRFGGLADLYLMLEDFFNRMKRPGSASINFSLPDGYFFQGYRGLSVNLFYAAAPYISFFRAVMNGVICMVTGIACYHKLRHFFSEQE